MSRPRPTPSPTTEAFWAATAENRFLIQRCRACGIAQFYPATWAEWGQDHTGDGTPDVWNPKDAIPSQAAYMCQLFKEVKGVSGDPTELALAAYNAGPTAVLNAGGIPRIDETRNYVARIEELIPEYTKTYAQQEAKASASASPISGD